MGHTGISSLRPSDEAIESIASDERVLGAPVLRALSDVAMELRAPLSVILGHAENLLQTEEVDDVIRSVSVIDKNGRRIDRITSDILTLGALEHAIAQRQRAPSSQSFQLQECINDLRDRLDSLMRDRTPILQVEVVPHDCRMSGDRYFWFLAFQYLLENALGENNRGLTVRITARQDAAATVIEFSDNGVGIPPNDLQHVFAPFFRSNRARNVPRRGVGLGLYYVRRVVEYHGGHLTVSSLPGIQTTFRITLEGRGG